MAAPDIKSFARIVPMIYAYNTPGITYHEGWTKIGYTEKQTVEQRIKQQTHTADIRWELAWKDNAIAQAYQEELSKMYGAYADVLIEAEKNSIKLLITNFEC